MSKQKNKGPSERELVISRIKNLMGIWSHIDFVTIPALVILAGALSGLLSHLLQLRRLK